MFTEAVFVLHGLPYHLVLLTNSYSSLKTHLKCPSSVRPPLVPGRVSHSFLCGARSPVCMRYSPIHCTIKISLWEALLLDRNTAVGWVGDWPSCVVRISTEETGPENHLSSSEPKPVGTHEHLLSGS